MKKEHVLTLAAGAVLGLGLYVAGPAKSGGGVVWWEGEKYAIPVGTAAPEFALRTVQGDTVSLADAAGKRLGLIFVSASCPYCHELLERLEELALQPDQELLVVCGSDEEAEEIRSSHAYSFAVVVDDGGRAQKSYKATEVPTVYVLDDDRHVAGVYKGWPSGWDNLRKWSDGKDRSAGAEDGRDHKRS